MSLSARDLELGMGRTITRRDFMNGAAMMVGASMLPGSGIANTGHAPEPQNRPGYDPPISTGMRGSHPGSFEVAHSVRDGSFFAHAGEISQTGETYDLVVVGAGISGLAAAYFYRKLAGNGARILLLANGGTLSIESPFPYSTVAHQLLSDLGIDPPALEAKCVDRQVYHGLQP